MKGIIFPRVLFLLLCLSPVLATVACAQTIAYGLGSQIWGMDVKTGHSFLLINGAGIPAWSRDGKTIAAVIEGAIWLADVRTRKSRMLIPADHQHFLGTPAWSEDGKYLYVGRYKKDDEEFPTDADGGLWQINVQNGQSRLMIKPEDSDLPIHENPLVSADGHYLISSGMIDGGAFFYAMGLRANKLKKHPGQPIFKFVTCYTFDKSSKMLLLGGDADESPMGKGPGGIWRWDLITNTCSPWMLPGQSIADISLSPNGKMLIIGLKEGDYVFSTAGKKLAKINVSGEIHHIAWLDNETFIAENAPTGDINQTNIIRYNIHTGKSHILVKGGDGVAVAGLRPH